MPAAPPWPWAPRTSPMLTGGVSSPRGDQPLDLLEHGRVVDLQLGLDAAIEHLLGKPFDLASGVVEHERAAVRGEEQDEPHIQRAHLGIEQCGAQALLVASGSDPRPSSAGRSRRCARTGAHGCCGRSLGRWCCGHRDRARGYAARRPRLPGGDALRHDLVRLLRQRRGGGLAVVTAGQGAGDDGVVLSRHWATHR